MSVRTTRARLAAVARHAPDSPAEQEARRDHAATLLDKRIREIVDAAPPLTEEQCARLRALLGPALAEVRRGDAVDAGPVAA